MIKIGTYLNKLLRGNSPSNSRSNKLQLESGSASSRLSANQSSSYLSRILDFFRAHKIEIGIILLYIFISFWGSRDIFFGYGNLDKFHDWIIPGSNKSAIEYSAPAWEAYSQRHLGSSPSYLTSQWFLTFIGLMGYLKLGWLIPVVILFIPLFLIQYLQYNLLYRGLGFNRKISMIGGLLYFLSPFVFYRIASGYIYFTMAYALFPFFLYSMQKAIIAKDLWRGLLWSFVSGWVVVVCGWQIQFFVFAIVFGGLWVLITKGTLWRKCIVCLSITITNVVAALPWVLPFVFKTSSSNARQALSLGFIDYQSNFTNLINVYKGYGSFVNYLTIWIAELHVSLSYFYYLSASMLMLTAFFGIYAAFNSKIELKINSKRLVLGCLVLLCVTLFLAKGFNEPFGEVNKYLYQRFILFGLFREIHHLSFVIVFILNIFTVWALAFVEKKYKFLNSLNYVSAIALILYMGLSLPLVSGNWGFLQRNKPSTEFLKTIDSLEGERVWFLPNLQPYAESTDSKYGGWDLTQSLSNISTLPQGNISDTYAKNQNNRLTYCLIFDKSCGSEVLPGLKRLGFDYIIVRNDVVSIYSKVSALGVFKDERELYNTFDYSKRLQELGLSPVKEFSDHTLFRLQPGFNKSYVQDSNIGYIGDVGLDANYSYTSLQYPLEETASLDYTIAAENKAKLLELFEYEDTIVHEPGFWVDGGGWRSFQSRWWLDNTTKSAYNGIFSEIEEAELISFINTSFSGQYDVWLIPGILPEQETGKVNIQIEGAGFDQDIEFTNIESQSVPRLLSTIDAETNSLEVKYTHLEGVSSIQGLVFVPKNGLKKELNSPIVLKNSQETINIEASNRNSISVPINSFDVSAFTDGGRETGLETRVSDSKLDLTAIFTEEESVGEFIILNKELRNTPISFVEEFSTALIPVDLKIPSELLIDINITLEDQEKTDTLFFKRFNNLDTRNILELDFKTLPNIAAREGFSDDAQITRISLLFNKKTNRELSDNSQFISLRDIEFVSPYTHYFSNDYLANYKFILNKETYYEGLTSYPYDPASSLWNFTPFLRDNLTTSVSQEANLILLEVDPLSSANEFAVAGLPDFDPIQFNQSDMVFIPVEFDIEDAFIDMVYSYSNDSGGQVRSQPIKSVTLSNEQKYMILDLKDIREVEGIENVTGVELVINKRASVDDKDQIPFSLGQPVYLSDYYDTFAANFTTDLKETFIDVWSPTNDEFTIEYLSSGDSVFETINLTEGLNTLKLPDYQDNTIFYKLYATPSDVQSSISVRDIELTEVSIGAFEFEIPNQDSNTIFVYQMMFDPDWILEVNGREIQAKRYNFLYNGFELNTGDGGKAVLKYRIQPIKTRAIQSALALVAMQLIIAILVGYTYFSKQKSN